MSTSIRDALGIPRLFDLIEAPGEFLNEVKHKELKRQAIKQSELKERYARLGRLIGLLRGDEGARRSLRDLYAHIPKLAMPAKHADSPLALHEFFLIKDFAWHHQNLLSFVRKQGWMDQFLLTDLNALFSLLDPEHSGMPAFRLSSAYSGKLGEIQAAKLEAANKLKHARSQLLKEASAELGLPNLLEEFVLSRADVALAERLLHSPYFTLGTESVANYTFILADDDACLELKKHLSRLQEKQEREEERVLKDLSRKVASMFPALRDAIHALEQTGWRFVLADFSLRYNCAIPKLIRKKSIHIHQAVNLPLKLHLEELGRRYQPVDLEFGLPVSVLTGPNMGGKTTLLKTLGQLCELARRGLPLPCGSAELPVFDRVWYNQDDLSSGADLSSFGREVVSFTETLREEGSTLFLLDEFARGTNPAEGELLASAVLRHLAATAHMCVAATHFTAPAMLEGLAHYAIAGLDTESPALREGRLLSPAQRLKALNAAMDYSLCRLRANQAPPLNAIRVARILGLPEEILKLAERKDT